MYMKKIITIDPSEISQGTLHNHLLSAVAPRPICFASTISANGQVNLSPFSFFNVFSSNPPIMIFSPSRSGRDNSTKHTHDNVLDVKEVVINIVNYPMVEQMSLASTAYDKGVNEFVKAGFTQVDSVKVKPPRVGEAPVAFECVVDEVKPLGTGPGAGNLVIARVVLIHIDEQYADAHGNLDTTKLDLVGRMGGVWYNRCTQDALFSIPKPITTKGIGIDGLPKYIRESNELTGNELARMGNLPELPNDKDIQMAYSNIVKPLVDSHLKLDKTLLNLAKDLISKDQPYSALSVLMTRPKIKI
jgi:flavin reductase (DIM6/NTAB) family NADH-FMN oxidoreductase RutF